MMNHCGRVGTSAMRVRFYSKKKLTLQGGLVTQSDLARLHHKCETGVEGVTSLGLLLGGHLDGFVRVDLGDRGRSGDGCGRWKG